MRAVALAQDRDFFAPLDAGERAQFLGLMRKLYGHYLGLAPEAG